MRLTLLSKYHIAYNSAVISVLATQMVSFAPFWVWKPIVAEIWGVARAGHRSRLGIPSLMYFKTLRRKVHQQAQYCLIYHPWSSNLPPHRLPMSCYFLWQSLPLSCSNQLWRGAKSPCYYQVGSHLLRLAWAAISGVFAFFETRDKKNLSTFLLLPLIVLL